MAIRRILFVVWLATLMYTFSFGGLQAGKTLPGTLSAGMAKILITPVKPIPMSGYRVRTEPFKGIHDDIYARVVVFSDGTNKAVIVEAEVIGFAEPFWNEFTDLVRKETGIQKEFIFLAAVHNHNGPTTRGSVAQGTSPDILAYMEDLKVKLLSATKEAIKNLVPVSIGVGKGACKMNVNRRAIDGKGGIALGVNPYGPCDHEVGVIRIDDRTGKPLSLLINWPCHAVVLGPKNYLISGDWPGAASKYVEQQMGENFYAMITVGASGDINPVYGPHIDFVDNNSYAFGKDAIGEDLGKEALRVMKNIKTFSEGTITASQRVISLPMKERDPGTPLPAGTPQETELKVRLSVLKIGNIILTGVSGEVFNQISVKMRNQSPYNNTFMITHCNGSSGYLVTEDSYALGGYEVNSTRAKTGAEKGIIEGLLEMITEL